MRALQTGGVEFGRSREDLVKDAFELHYGKRRISCVWTMTNTRDKKPEYFGLRCFYFVRSVLNLSLVSPSKFMEKRS